MDQTLSWNEYLEAIAEHLTRDAPYICCHIDGGFLESGYIKTPSKAYLKAVGEGCKDHNTRLLETIHKELAELRITTWDNSISTLSKKLGFPFEDGVQGRQDWLRSLKD